MGTTITLADDQVNVSGYLAEPSTPGPSVLVVHDWFGLLPHIRLYCDALAEVGFVAFAPDLYGGSVTTEPTEAERLLADLDITQARQRLDATIGFLRTQHAMGLHRVGAVGFSIGGWLALLTATTGTLDAVVAYYAILNAGEFAPIPCPVLLNLAETDDWDPEDAPDRFVSALGAAGSTVEAHVYAGTEHSFANGDVAASEPRQSRKAWTATLDFLQQHLRV
jgi:carboxymethylenebutenolidase